MVVSDLAGGSEDRVTYNYNDRDQLIKETRTMETGGLACLERDGSATFFAARTPSRWPGRVLLALTAMSLTALLAPVLLLRTRRNRAAPACPLRREAKSRVRKRTEGVTAARTRIRRSAISIFLAVLFIISPEAIAQLHNESMAYRALAAGALGQTINTTVNDYVYDDNGNLIDRWSGDGQEQSLSEAYTYDAENGLVRHDPGGGPATIVSYAYDADGNRTSKTVNGSTTYFIVDTNRPFAQVLEERDTSGALVVRYVHGLDLISQTRASDTHYYHTDGQLSTRFLTDTNGGAITDTYNYDAFGNLLNADDAFPTDNNYRYTGEQLDDSVGMYYLRARYYYESLGQFTSRDPFDGFIDLPQSLNRYQYAFDDPVNRIDPSGLFSLAEVKIATLNGVLAILRVVSALHNVVALRLLGFTSWVLNHLIQIEFYLSITLIGAFFAGSAAEWIERSIDRLVNNSTPIPATKNAGPYVENIVRANATEYQTVDVLLDEADGKKSVISLGSRWGDPDVPDDVYIKRVLNTVEDKAKVLNSDRVITPKPGIRAPVLKPHQIGSRAALIAIPEHKAHILTNPIFVNGLRAIQRAAGRVRVVVAPLRGWRK